jgi:hypothetical protein
MAQATDYVVANAAGSAVRSDINSILSAISTQNSGATEPSTMYAYMLWADTTASRLKMRNGSNSSWIEVGVLDATGLNIVTTIFSNVSSTVTCTSAELNTLTGLTSTTAELNLLDGATVTTAEINLLDGVTSTTAELNILDGVTATKDEINAVDMSASSSTSGQVLTSNGTSSAPTFQTLNNAVVQVETIQTRATTSYTCNYSTQGDGIEITELTMTITPRKAGNKMILEWVVADDSGNTSNLGYVVSRNDTLLTDSTDSSNNRWAVTSTAAYDANDNSTPTNTTIRIIDEDTLAVSSEYKLLVRATASVTATFKLNRSWDGAAAGQDSYEQCLSSGIATEINT